MVDIKRVTARGERSRFINFPYKLYEDDTYWVPPLKMEQKELINIQKNPFYNNADIAMFLAQENGQIVGRIAAIEDRRYNEYQNAKTGFFGFFESIEDQKIASQLLKAASDWLKERGLTEILGPSNPGMMDEIGILVDGFDLYPSILMPYNKHYYDGL